MATGLGANAPGRARELDMVVWARSGQRVNSIFFSRLPVATKNRVANFGCGIIPDGLDSLCHI